MFIQIDKTSKIPMIRQIYRDIRAGILNGSIKKGTKLPSSRELASNLGISRNVILEAYEQLLVEGYIESIPGSGTYVTEGAYLENYQADRVSGIDDNDRPDSKGKKDVIDFKTGIPDLNLFPRRKWGQLYKDILNDTTAFNIGYHSPKGSSELRNTLSGYLHKTRGVQCHPDQIVITTGAVQAIALISRLLLSTGDPVFVEDPLNNDIQQIVLRTGAKLVPIPVDSQGMRTGDLSFDLSPKAILTTPSHQFPMGCILQIKRRVELIQYARKKNCYIIEDDYDSEFRYEGAPVSSLQSLAPDKVIYIGTFSKILCPSLRIGYIILPFELTEPYCELKHLLDNHSPIPEQVTLARFISEGYLERHIRKSKKIYEAKQSLLKKCLHESFHEQIDIIGSSTGLHLVAAFKGLQFSKETFQLLENSGVRAYSVEMHAYNKGCHQNKILLGYGNLSENEIIEGVRRLKSCLTLANPSSVRQ